MRVVAVRPGSSAAAQGVVAGDILVQIHRWYTTSEQDVRYILSRGDSIAKLGAVRFDIVRGGERFFGQLALERRRQRAAVALATSGSADRSAPTRSATIRRVNVWPDRRLIDDRRFARAPVDHVGDQD